MPVPELHRERPTADPAGPGLAVVVFGLASAIAWGAGDFGGGWTSRRAPVLGIAIGVDLLGAIVMVCLAVATGEPVPGPATLGLAALAGLLAVAGILGLYQGLAVGRMGVVAPVTGVIAATLPVIVGLVAQGWPGTEVVVGIILALTAVLLVSRTSDPAGRRSGIEYALLGGIGLGLFNIAVGAFPEHRVAWPLAVIKAGSLLPIEGLTRAEAKPGVRVFHAGTKQVEGRLVTAGGRVLSVAAVAADLPGALRAAYDAVGEIRFDGMHYRTDIGQRAVRAEAPPRRRGER